MKHKSLVSRLKSAGFQVEEHREEHFSPNIEGGKVVSHDLYETVNYTAQGEKNIASWWCDCDGEMRSVYVKGLRNEDDIYADYFSGIFYDTLRGVVNGLLRSDNV